MIRKWPCGATEKAFSLLDNVSFTRNYYRLREQMYNNLADDDSNLQEVASQIRCLPTHSKAAMEFKSKPCVVRQVNLQKLHKAYNFWYFRDTKTNKIAEVRNVGLWDTFFEPTAALIFKGPRTIEIYETIMTARQSADITQITGCTAVCFPYPSNKTLVVTDDNGYGFLKNLFSPFCFAFCSPDPYCHWWWWFYWFQYHMINQPMCSRYFFMYIYNSLNPKRINRVKWDKMRTPSLPLAAILSRLGIMKMWKLLVDPLQKCGQLKDGNYIIYPSTSANIHDLLHIILFDSGVYLNQRASDVWLEMRNESRRRLKSEEVVDLLLMIADTSLISDEIAEVLLTGMTAIENRPKSISLKTGCRGEQYIPTSINPFSPIGKENLGVDEELIFLAQAAEGIRFSINNSTNPTTFIGSLDRENPQFFFAGQMMPYSNTKIPPVNNFALTRGTQRLDFVSFVNESWAFFEIEGIDKLPPYLDYEMTMPLPSDWL